MAPELGGSQISALLESVPGIARVLRSPVADSLVNMIRAGAGLAPFDHADADELVQYAVRRGLISAVEGEGLSAELQGVKGRKRGSSNAWSAPPKRAAAKRSRAVPAKKAKTSKTTVKKTSKKSVKRR